MLGLVEAIKSIAAAIGSLLPYVKKRRAERFAGEAPSERSTSIIEDMMDGALLRLGTLQPQDPWWQRCVIELEGTLVRPELFKRPSVREWLSRSEVKQGLKHAAEMVIAGNAVPQDLIDQLADEYAQVTGEHRDYADQAIRIAIAFLQASVQASVQDQGTAAIFQATASGLARDIQGKFSELANAAAQSTSRFVLDRMTEEGRLQLDCILRRRATQGQNTVEELRKLVRDFEDGGRLFAAAPALKDSAACWLARVEAWEGNGPTAERLLTKLEQSGYAVPSVAWALVDLARNDVPAALQHIRDLVDPESQAVIFHVLLKGQGRTAALQYVDTLAPLVPTSFTAVGWNNVCACLVAEGQIDRAATLLGELPASVLSQCTSLYYFYALSQLLPMLPIERQSSLFHLGFLAVAENSLDSAESSAARMRGLAAAELARNCAADVGDRIIEGLCEIGIRCLRLLAEQTRDQETTSIIEAMRDGEAAVKLVALARAYSIEFEPQPLEDYLGRAQRLGGLNKELREAKFFLLAPMDRSRERLRFIDEEWENLISEIGLEFLIFKKVEALVHTDDVDGAAEFLDAHAHQFEEPQLARIRLMLDSARGEDPSDAVATLFSQSNTIEDLHNLVRFLKSRKRWKKLAPYAEQLFNREPNFDSAMLRLLCLQETQADAREINAFLDTTIRRVDQRPEIRSARAWAKFEVGDHLEAKRLNDELLATRDDVNDFALDVNIAIRTGDWERFASIGTRGLERRSTLSGRMLLTLAKLVGLSDPAQSLILAQEAVEQEGDDPAILVGANTIAIAARRDDLAIPWVHRAAEKSKEGGPVSVFSYREMVEFMKSNAESWKHKNEMYRTAQMPLHLAASVFNAPFSQLLIAVPRQNAREVDPRRRQPVPIRSGNRVAVEHHGVSRVALDVTTLFVLSELGMLEKVLDSFEAVFVSPRLMDVLLEDRGRVAFHQPSRVAEVKPLIAWVASGRLKVVDVRAEIELAAEVGEESAVLLKEAEITAGMYIHAGTLFKVASYMDEEADLGTLRSRLAGPVDVLNALRQEGVITQAEGDEALALLERTGMDVRQVVLPEAPLYLDRAAIQYLAHAKLLQPLLNSAHPVYVYKSTVNEWHELLATEPMTDEVIKALDAIRNAVRAALMSGKVNFLSQSRKREEVLNATTMLPMLDLLEDVAHVDAVVLDDRMAGSGITLTDSTGKSVPLMSSLDLLDMLEHKGLLSNEAKREALHILRVRCFFCIPIVSADIEFYLAQAVVQDDQLKETAELRTLRQYLARLNATDVLCTVADLQYQETLWRVASYIIGKLWMNSAIPVGVAEAKSDWVVAHILPDLELVMRFAPDGRARINEVAAAQISASVMPPSADAGRREAYARWFQGSRILQLLPANSHVLDIVADQTAQSLIRLTSEIANEFRSQNSANSAQ
ncbi:hypothetical protein ABE612_22685 [Achromobacter xylosoxidans]|uniref:HTH domain-containing protein n=1 Tax=Alcaligenes xylosoxydans xylosoxydans TaxID=85698 RepID=UPI003208791A